MPDQAEVMSCKLLKINMFPTAHHRPWWHLIQWKPQDVHGNVVTLTAKHLTCKNCSKKHIHCHQQHVFSPIWQKCFASVMQLEESHPIFVQICLTFVNSNLHMTTSRSLWLGCCHSVFIRTILLDGCNMRNAKLHWVAHCKCILHHCLPPSMSDGDMQKFEFRFSQLNCFKLSHNVTEVRQRHATTGPQCGFGGSNLVPFKLLRLMAIRRATQSFQVSHVNFWPSTWVESSPCFCAPTQHVSHLHSLIKTIHLNISKFILWVDNNDAANQFWHAQLLHRTKQPQVEQMGWSAIASFLIAFVLTTLTATVEVCQSTVQCSLVLFLAQNSWCNLEVVTNKLCWPHANSDGSFCCCPSKECQKIASTLAS